MKFCRQNDNKKVYINFENLHLSFFLFTTIPKMYINIMVSYLLWIAVQIVGVMSNVTLMFLKVTAVLEGRVSYIFLASRADISTFLTISRSAPHVIYNK